MSKNSFFTVTPKPAKNIAKSKKVLALVVIVIMIAQFFVLFANKEAIAAGTIYYVDSSITDTNVASATPDCTNYDPAAFTCGGGSASAYKTMADVNAKTFSSDDQILFRKGQTWREQLTVPSSGTSGHPITFGAFGTGASSSPIISGSDIKSSWTLEAMNTENFTDGTGTKPQAWWGLSEASGNRADSNTTTNNILSESGGTISRTAGPTAQVPYAATVTASSSQTLTRTDANLSSGFPGKNGVADIGTTFGAWVKVANLSSSRGVMAKWLSYGLTIQSNGTLQVSIDDDSYSWHEASAGFGTITTNAWFHVVGRWNQSTGAISVFINGSEPTYSAHATSTTMEQDASGAFRLGQSENWEGYFDGSIAEPFVFSSALTNQQIQDIYVGSLAGFTANLYYAPISTGDPRQVLEDGTRLTAVTSKTALVAGSFWYDSANSRFYIRTREDDNPSGHTIEAGARDFAVSISGKSNLTFSGLTLRAARGRVANPQAGHGMFATGNFSNLTVDGITSEWNFNSGWCANEPSATVTGIVIKNSTFQFNGASGIDMSVDNWTGWLIDKNQLNYNSKLADTIVSDHNWSAGVKLFSLPQTGGNGSVVSNNVAHDNGITIGYIGAGVGIWLDTVTGVTVTNNLAYNNEGPGVFLEKTINSVAKYNITYNDTLAALRAGTDDSSAAANIWVAAGCAFGICNSSGNLIANNVSYGGWWGVGNSVYYGSLSDGSNISNNTFRNNIATGASGHNFAALNGGDNDTAHGSGNVYDHNAFGAQASNFVLFTTAKSTYAALDSAYGSAMNNVQSDPLFTNAGSHNFTLQAASPAINTGVNLGSTYQLALDPSSSWPSSVVTANQNYFGSGWEMGAYVYPSAPLITGIASTTTASLATITWITDGQADSQVQYGLTASYGSSTTLDSTATTTHSVGLTGLSSLTQYHFMVESSNGTLSTSSDRTLTAASAGLPAATVVTVTGTAAAGSTLTGSYTFSDPNGNAESGTTLQWLRASDSGGSYSAIGGATSATYILTSADIGQYLKFQVIPKSASGIGSAALSSATMQVLYLGGGGGLPSVAYTPPQAPSGEFKVMINNGATVTSDRKVILSFVAGADVKNMVISNTGDFKDAGQQAFAYSLPWDLCSAQNSYIIHPDCAAGIQTVSVKFLTAWGQPSAVIKASIDYQPGSTSNKIDSTQPANVNKTITIPSPAAILASPVQARLLTQLLKPGSRGKQVIVLQDLLKQLRFFPQDTKSNGVFGSKTLKAVKAFQTKYNIAKPGQSVFGQVGPKTRKMLNQLSHLRKHL